MKLLRVAFVVMRETSYFRDTACGVAKTHLFCEKDPQDDVLYPMIALFPRRAPLLSFTEMITGSDSRCFRGYGRTSPNSHTPNVSGAGSGPTLWSRSDVVTTSPTPRNPLSSDQSVMRAATESRKRFHTSQGSLYEACALAVYHVPRTAGFGENCGPQHGDMETTVAPS